MGKGRLFDVSIPGFCGMGLNFSFGGLSVLYCIIGTFMWFVAIVFSKEYYAHYKNKKRYYLFLVLTYIATMGVFISADFYTLFVFFEMMSFTSYVWVAQDEKEEALRAGATYLAVAVIGGLVLLMGLWLLYDAVGTQAFDKLGAACAAYENKARLYAAGGCMLFGFGAKAGAFPLHIWLPKAHPAAPAPASALLSGILTKTGIFGIILLSSNLFFGDRAWGLVLLITAAATMVTGAVTALYSVNLKRILACSSVSQIGFILIGISMAVLMGEEGALAARGAVLHMVNHSFFKLVLFLCAGVVFMNIHELDLTKIRGFGKKKPLFHIIFLIGAAGISGIPLGSGYISKTLLHESIVEYSHMLNGAAAAGMKAVEWLFLISGGCTVAYMLKIYAALFLEKNTDQALQQQYDDKSLIGAWKKRKSREKQKVYMNAESACVLSLAAVFLLLMGVFPRQSMEPIAEIGQLFFRMNREAEPMVYYSAANLTGSLVSIAIGAGIYLFVVRGLLMKKGDGNGKVYADRWPVSLDLEEKVYRPLFLKYLNQFFTFLCRILDGFTDYAIVLLRKTVYRDSKPPQELNEGTLMTHYVGSMMDLGSRVRHRKDKEWKRDEKKKRHQYEHRLALLHEEVSENNVIIGRSLSFGLLLFCAGLVLTLVYMLFW